MILFYIMLAYVVAIAILFSRCRAPESEKPHGEQACRFEKLIAKWDGNAFSYLYYLNDKQVLLTIDKRNGTDRAALLYRPQGTTLIVLDDPFDDPDPFNQLSAGFIDYADTFQCSVAFYEVGGEYLA